MSLLSRWKSPTPAFFKKVIRFSIITAAGAGAALTAGPLGSQFIPGFAFTLYPWAHTICVNLVVGGIIAAAVAKAAKVDVSEETLNIKKTVTTDADVVTQKTETTFTKTEAATEEKKQD